MNGHVQAHMLAASVLIACASMAWATEAVAPDSTQVRQAMPAYESAFREYRPATEEKTTPVQVWRNANDEMGRLKGHAGHLKDVPPAASGNTHEAHHLPMKGEKK
jgi:hypothetical protein